MKLKKLTILALIALIPSIASAKCVTGYNSDKSNYSGDSDGKYISILDGLYLEGNLGAGFVDMNTSNGKSKSETEFTASVALGYMFSLEEFFDLEGMYLGPEFGYKYFSTSKYNQLGEDLEVDADALSLLAVLMANLDEDWAIFGKIGAAYVMNDSVGIGINPTITAPTGKKHKSWNLELAAGVGYMLSEQFELVGTLDHIFKDTDETPGLTSLTVGLRLWL